MQANRIHIFRISPQLEYGIDKALSVKKSLWDIPKGQMGLLNDITKMKTAEIYYEKS